MGDLALRRSSGDRRLYELEGVGTLRLEGLWSRRAAASARGRTWTFARRGVFRTVLEAFDATGGEAGSFSARAIRRGGDLEWGGRSFAMRPASRWRERYALAEAERELAVFDARGWGRRPVEMTLHDDAADPGLLLFAAFIARSLAADAAAAST